MACATLELPVSESYPRLLSLAVHELRTPISVVGGYLRLLQHPNAEQLTDRQRKMIEEAEKSCSRLSALIAELSDISKLDSGVLTLGRQPVDVFPLVAEVAGHVHEAEDRGVHLETRGDSGGAVVSGDAARLRSAFDAVFRAILREKAGPCTVIAEKRRMTSNGGTSAVVVIADENDVQDLYESPAGVFDEKRGGLGLALPLARRVIEQHGGRLWSAAPRGGGDDGRARGSAIISLPLAQ